EENNYYPFGLKHEGYNPLAGNPSYKYKYNGKELQETGMYDYGARFYMPDIGRWGVSDGKGELYLSKSPYNYANNTPINAIDPDGNLVIFINGMHTGEGGSSKYWTSSMITGHLSVAGGQWMPMYRRFDMEVMNHFNDYNAIYRDGGLGGAKNLVSQFLFGSFSNSSLSSSNRISSGYNQGLRDAKDIIANLAKDSTTGEIIETIKIVTHSMGGAYGKGYTTALLDYAKKHGLEKQVKITLVADFDPFQAGELTANPKVHTLQFTNKDKKGRKDSDGLGGLANEVENGLPMGNHTENTSDAAHSIMSFFGNISQLQQGTYEWNGGNWICTSCNDKVTP
ncbi:RHS repeat-associated core domain-containing protein, partial [Chryseobacterium sp. Tr-659]|uniref:RHS repeat-associated core domain-containing protein n=1 Tax=Chryseobacterium sp. Tr-659 TaxID=2608340 RepID=UPI001422EF96